MIKFLTRHPSQTVELFMMEATLNDPQWSRMFMVSHRLPDPLALFLPSSDNTLPCPDDGFMAASVM